MKRLVINPGQVFNNLTVISENEIKRLPSGQKVRSFSCRCVCGKITSVLLVHLVRYKIKSCGCVTMTKNGDGGTHLCKLWRSLKYRTSEKGIDRHRYFDRGIGVCEEWLNDYFSFKEWALNNGYKKELQIDRINNNLGYFPENCRFVSLKENARNKENTIRVTYKGETLPLITLLDKLSLSDKYELISGRIRNGWDITRAIETPPRKLKKVTNLGLT